MTTSDGRPAGAYSDGRPAGFVWHYDRTEIIADGVVHGLGLALGLAGAVALSLYALGGAPGSVIAAVLVYITGLLAVLGFSAAYNLWPVSRAKWLLRRFDHSAIYLLIAATYTPFMLHSESLAVAGGLLAALWAVAAVGITLKLFLPGRFDRLSIALYLLLGWSGVLAYEAVFGALSAATVWLLAAGGILYTVGVVFHLWHSLRFQNAVWHGFVLAAAACHYFAVLDTVALASP